MLALMWQFLCGLHARKTDVHVLYTLITHASVNEALCALHAR